MVIDLVQQSGTPELELELLRELELELLKELDDPQ